MSATPLEALKNQITLGKTVAVIGAGVSMALTDNSPTASWIGLIRSGISRASSFNYNLPTGWKEHLEQNLRFAQDENYLPGLLSTADEITRELGGEEGGEFRAWLRDDIGQLEVQSAKGRELITAIKNLGIPIATTNYDTLLEGAMRRSPSTWQDPSDAQQIIRGASDNILHLHGVWQNPSSIVFSPTSYGQLLANRPAQAVEQLLAGGNSLVFIGCGEGLGDPNFEALRGWLTKVFPAVEARHYRLCLEQEVGQFAQQHSGERIVPIPYGDSFESLAGFINQLRPSADRDVNITRTTTEVVQKRAVEAIYARVRSETVMADHLADVDSRTLDGILIPPVLLPMTQEQFAQSLNLEKDERPRRCDPNQDVRNHGRMLIISDVTAGLTSALEWLVTQANNADDSLTPVIVDFRSLGQGHRPLERQVRKELQRAGANLRPADSLPKIAIALDNLTTRPDKIFSRAIDELKEDTYAFCVIGCHQGSEAEIIDRLTGSGMKPAVRYIGRLNGRDATRMAALIEPARAERLAMKAIEIAKNECLPRTPLTIGLLVCMLLRGETLLSAASPTALLDAWVNLLLGRGDPHDDARFSLDSLEKADILAFLAERFVQARTGSLPEEVAIACLREYFEAVGWSEDPIEVLGNFKSRYLLTVSNGQVRFAQSSYLHLFAAKRAKESEKFRFRLYDELLYFSPIIQHYAALTRTDQDLLGRVEQLLSPSEAVDSSYMGRNFSAVDGEQISAASIDDLVRHLSLTPGDNAHNPQGAEDAIKPGDGEEVDQESNGEDEADDWMDSWLDHLEDSDREPFPIENIEDASPMARITAALTLASNVLRDSELVKDLELKQRVLQRTLLIWGKFVDLLESDEDFARFWNLIANTLSEMLNMSDTRRAKFVEEFSGRAPVLMGFHGVSVNLSSRKLLRSLDGCFADPYFLGDAGGTVMGALLAYDINASGWTKYFLEVQRGHGQVMAVSDTMRLIAEAAYYTDTLGNDDSDRLLEFLVAQYAQRVSRRSAAERKVDEARIAQQLKKNRIITRARGPRLSIKAFATEIESGPEG